MKTFPPALSRHACLLSLLLTCASSSSPKNYPFLTTLAFAKAELPRRFGNGGTGPRPGHPLQAGDALAVGPSTGPAQLVTPAHPFELRSYFKALSEPAAEAKVSIALMPAAVQPSRWLALYLQGQHEKVLHERHVAQVGGAIPDVLTSSGAPGQERISRWIVLKDQAKDGGAHLFMLHVSTAAGSYTTDMANVFFVLISNFDLLHPGVKGQ